MACNYVKSKSPTFIEFEIHYKTICLCRKSNYGTLV